jgi:hypothetical protein
MHYGLFNTDLLIGFKNRRKYIDEKEEKRKEQKTASLW